MAEEFKFLFSPIKIGPMTVRNRIVCTAHATGMDENGMPGERLLWYHVERAKGGAGMIIMELAGIHPTSQNLYGGNINNLDARVIPYYKKIADAVHDHGAKILSQIWHGGCNVTSGNSMLPSWAPSPVPSIRERETPHQMELEEIEEIIDAYGQAALRLKESGLDGVEIHSIATSLITQFMSPLYNKRTDQYGGCLDNRLRFAYRVIHRIREKVEDNFVVGMRIIGDELVPGGMTLDDAKEIAKRLEASKELDYLNVTMGCVHTYPMIIPPMVVPLGCAVFLASGIKEVVDGIPIITAGRINDPLQAEKILAEGHADMIGMARALICDPEFPVKAKEGKLEDIRTCVACNHGCIGRLFTGKHITCVQNPMAGREKELDSMKPAQKKKRVVVIGGGPAGLEAARNAAMRGHQVTLYEMMDELGGQVRIAAKVPNREEFGGIIRYLSLQVKKLGVRVELGIEVTPEMARDIKPDAIIVATGSIPLKNGFSALRPDLPGIKGADQANVFTVWDVLLERVEVGENVILIDDDGHHKATSTAEFLTDKGKKVEILTHLPMVGIDLVPSLDQPLLYQRLFEKGVTFTPHTGIKEILGDTVICYNIYTGEERRIDGINTVVLAMENEANDYLYRVLKDEFQEIYAVGDCVTPRRVEMAIYEGNQVGRLV